MHPHSARWDTHGQQDVDLSSSLKNGVRQSPQVLPKNLVCLCRGSTVQMLVKEIDGFLFVIELWDNYIYVMDCDDAMWAKTQLGQTAPTITLSTEDMISSN